MSWNYRVVRRDAGDGSGETFLAIHEAYYEKGKERPAGITKEAVTASAESLEELGQVLDMMRAALSKPVLEYDDF